jgi:general secretion pathway protein H
MRSASKASAGFTLVELLVVLAILGLLLVIAPISVANLLPGVSLKADVREAAALLKQTRNRALRDNAEMTLLVDTETKVLVAEVINPKGDALPKRLELDADVEMELLTAQSEVIDPFRGRIRFFPDGTSTGGSIVFAAGSRKYHV